MTDDDTARLSIVQKQKTWDAKFEDVEKKESELMTTQWGMMREQLRSLTTDLAKAQVEIEALKKANAQMTVMFKKQLQDTDDELEKEKASRAAGDDNLQKQIDELKKLLAEGDKKTQSDLEKLKEWVKGKIDPLEKGLGDTNKKVADATKDIDKLKSEVDLLEKKNRTFGRCHQERRRESQGVGGRFEEGSQGSRGFVEKHDEGR